MLVVPPHRQLRHHLRHQVENLSIEKILLFFSVILGLFFTFIVPPFQKADETTHFYKAISVASGRVICQKNEQGVFQNTIPNYLANFPQQTLAMHIASNANYVFPKALYVSTIEQQNFDRNVINEPSSCSLPSLLYLPVGFVLAVPVLLGLNPLFIFFLGRFTQFVMTFLIFYWAYKIIPKKFTLLPLFVLALPMTLYQLSSFSKDALHLSCGVLAISYLLLFIESKKVTWKALGVFLTSLALSIFARPQYLLFGFLSLLIPFRYLKKNRLSTILPVFFVIGLVVAILFSLSLETYSAKATSLATSDPNAFVYPSLQLQFLKEHPFTIPSIISQTLEVNYIFYLQSMIAMLGWLEYGLPWYVYGFYLALAGYVFAKICKELPKLSPFHFLVLNGVVWGTLLATFFSFYLYASPVASATVLGVQGRYFLLLLPLLFWLAANLIQYFHRKIFVFCVWVIFIAAVVTVFVRYYDGSHHYYRGVESLPAVSRDQSLFITQPITSQVTIDSSKKLRGISIFIFKQQTPEAKPYQVSVYDASCKNRLAQVIVPAKSYREDDWNDLLFTPNQNLEHICLKFGPYQDSLPKEESLQIAADKEGRILAIPIYLN